MHAESRINFLAPILAWLLPGLGHVALGHRKRGLLIGAGVLAVYLMGLLIGGFDVIDRKGDFLWYCGQMFAGPQTPIISAWRESHRPPKDPAIDPGHTYAQPSFSHANEIGTLYASLAGMLNLLAILDVVVLGPNQPAKRRRRAADHRPDSAPHKGGAP